MSSTAHPLGTSIGKDTGRQAMGIPPLRVFKVRGYDLGGTAGVDGLAERTITAHQVQVTDGILSFVTISAEDHTPLAYITCMVAKNHWATCDQIDILPTVGGSISLH